MVSGVGAGASSCGADRGVMRGWLYRVAAYMEAHEPQSAVEWFGELVCFVLIMVVVMVALSWRGGRW